MSTTTTATSSETSAVAEGLKIALADSYALMAQTHLAHWNVEGPHFFHLHAAFQTQYEELFTAIDDIAERIRTLGVMAPGGLKKFGSTSKLPEMDDGPAPAKDFVAHLVECHEMLLANAADLRKVCEEAGDLETQDMVIARVQVHEKTLWMLKSTLKNL
jgi:starvation-inducible DNA-binding protein